MRTIAILGGALCLLSTMTGCGDDTGAGGTGAVSWTGGAGGGAEGGGAATTCLAAEGEATSGSETWADGSHQATVTIADRESCTRTYELSTTAPLRDNMPDNPRSYAEVAGQPVIRTGNDMFDALYALAVEETRNNSVDSISNFAFNGGNPIPCASGGCFETGRLWTYVWTRDTSYAVALGLGSLDPTRARNSLEFKTSARRDGVGREIVQDTGTGGSWPISTDRVVWAIGAWELLKFLDGAERSAFVDLAYESITNTLERDRKVIWDPTDGLYRGEQSFLDWREQTYPAWTATDTVQIGMSKSLGTNLGHLRLLEVGAALAKEKGLSEASTQYESWADDLRAAIRSELYLPEAGLFSTYKTTRLDPSAAGRYDLLGEAFAVLFDAAETPDVARSVVASYPHLPQGAPVIWPQQQDTPIYHNRSIWPFVTAFWAKAAAKVGNAAATDHAIASLVRGAALNLSNMENFEAVSGAAWLDDGAASGPVVNSQRQLWSVAGYLSVVQDVVFGLDASQQGIRFAPHISAELKARLFPGAQSIALSNFTYRNKRIGVRVRFPADASGSGFYSIAAIRLNDKTISEDFVASSDLESENVFEIDLGDPSGDAGSLTSLDDGDIADYQNLFGPRTPAIGTLAANGASLTLQWDAAGEQGVTFDVYRDGLRVAEGLTTTSWTDPDSSDHTTVTHCYTVDATFPSGARSQHARPVCHFGDGNTRIQTFDAQSFAASGGSLVMNHGRWHYENWGEPGDTLTVTNVVPTQSGTHLLQVVAGNGAGDFTTGVTCGVKAIEVWDGSNLVGSGYLVMPHLATWDDWRDSNFVSVDLTAGTNYTVVIREDDASYNMSELDHFSLYGGTGGIEGRFNKVNIAELKLLAGF
ncbi:MAG: hypothetical protein HOW73_36720 [Polyangiaceae bacterium]|nr:hypothetical protein [Polyangiaceae bacterium]